MMTIDVCFKSSEGLQNLLREEEAISQLLRRCSLLRKVFLKNGNFISYFCRIHGKIWNMALLKKVAPRVLPFSDKK